MKRNLLVYVLSGIIGFVGLLVWFWFNEAARAFSNWLMLCYSIELNVSIATMAQGIPTFVFLVFGFGWIILFFVGQYRLERAFHKKRLTQCFLLQLALVLAIWALMVGVYILCAPMSSSLARALTDIVMLFMLSGLCLVGVLILYCSRCAREYEAENRRRRLSKSEGDAEGR